MVHLKENESQECQYFKGALSTLNQDEMKFIVKATRKHRLISQLQKIEEKVKLTNDSINEILNQSKIYYININQFNRFSDHLYFSDSEKALLN